jgi:hypothetical protein
VAQTVQYTKTYWGDKLMSGKDAFRAILMRSPRAETVEWVQQLAAKRENILLSFAEHGLRKEWLKC